MIQSIVRQIRHSILGDQHVQESLRGAGIALVLMVLGLGFSLGFNVVLARQLGANGIGLFALSLDTIGLVAMLATFGLNKAVLRATAVNSGQAKWETVWDVYAKSVLIILIISLIASIALVMIVPFLATRVFHKPDLAKPMYLMSLAIIPSSLLSLQVGALKGLKKIRDSIFLERAGMPFIGLLALLLFGRHINVVGAVVIYIVSVFALLVYAGLIWHSSIPAARESRQDRIDIRSLLVLAWPFFTIDLTNMIAGKSGSVLLGVWARSEDVGIYNVALRVAVLVSIVLVAMNSILSPKIASMYAQQDIQALESLARNSTRIMFLIAMIIAVPLLLYPEIILGLFGQDFIAGASLLRILLLGQLVNVAAGPVGTLLLMTKYENIHRNNVLITSFLNMILGLLIIPRFGVTGAAIVFSLSLILMNVAAILLVRVYLGINVWAIRA